MSSRNGTSSPACPYKPKTNTMTQRALNKLKSDLFKMSRIELVETIWEHSSDELETIEDVLTIAKETDNQLKERLYSILSWFEYLAK